MCRLLGYLGPTVPVSKLLLDPPNSLVNQSRGPRQHPVLQLAGWGFALWSQAYPEPDRPLIYRRAVPAFFDDNLNSMVPCLEGELLLAHLRAATYQPEGVITDENCHPFRFERAPWILAHNGFVLDWKVMLGELLDHAQTQWLRQIRGTTDTELVYCLLLSLLAEREDPYDFETLREVLGGLLNLFVEAGKACGNHRPLKLKLLLASPGRLLAVNYGAGEHGNTDLSGDWKNYRQAPIDSKEFLLSTLLEPLYFLQGKSLPYYYTLEDCPEEEFETALITSEPLTDEPDRWQELAFGEMILIERHQHGLRRRSGSVFSSDSTVAR